MPIHEDTVRKFEEHLLNSWPSQRTVMCNGWIFRRANGYTKRANSACAVAAQRVFSSTLDHAETFYASFGSATIFRMTPLAGAEPDRMLENRGYRVVDETIVKTTPLSGAYARDPSVQIGSACSDIWETGYADAHALDEGQRQAHRAILDGIAPLPTAFAQVHDGDRAIAFGLGVIERGSLGLFDIVTVPDARRKGAARKLVAGLMNWGSTQGARAAWLGVIADNEKALPLYEQFGFRECYRYHYRVSS